MQEPINTQFSIGPRLFTRKDKLQLQELLFHTQLDRGSFTILNNAVAYGLTKTFGLELFIPWFFQNNVDGKKTSGLGDILVEAQWNFYPQLENVGIATLGIRFPTGSTRKEPNLGFGTYGWIFELAGVHSSNNWYASTSFRVRINQRRKTTTPGTRFSYALTGGPKLHLKNGAKIHTICQLDGIYDAKIKKYEKTLFDSGRHVILLGPLISYQKENMIVEGSMQLPIAQKVRGEGAEIRWVSIFTVEVTL